MYKNLGVTADAKESLKPILPIENKNLRFGWAVFDKFRKGSENLTFPRIITFYSNELGCNRLSKEAPHSSF